MLNWFLLLALAVFAVCVADRAWQRHVARVVAGEEALHDPDGYLELTARMTELCHGDRMQVEQLIAEQKHQHPHATHGEAVRLAMQRLPEPDATTRRSD